MAVLYKNTLKSTKMQEHISFLFTVLNSPQLYVLTIEVPFVKYVIATNLKSCFLFVKVTQPSFLSPTSSRRSWSGDYEMPSVRASVRAFVCLSVRNVFI